MIHQKGCYCFNLKNLFFLVLLRVLRGQLIFPSLTQLTTL